MRSRNPAHPNISRAAATHIFNECFAHYEVLAQAGADQLAEETRLIDFVIDFEAVTNRVLNPVERKLFKMRVKYRKKHVDCKKAFQFSPAEYMNIRMRIRIKLGRGLHDFNLWPLEKYFDENHAKKVGF